MTPRVAWVVGIWGLQETGGKNQFDFRHAAREREALESRVFRAGSCGYFKTLRPHLIAALRIGNVKDRK
jgi:hypothetical protein